jgi:hypothetical protein
MQMIVLCRTLFVVGLLPALLRAQEGDFRIEMERYPSRASRMLFVNDSSKDVDAFHVAITCNSLTHEKFGDILGGPHNGGTSIPASGGNWDAGTAIQEEGRFCTTSVDAVIYSDGSFYGPVEIVRRMHAAREGGFAAVRLWASLIEQRPVPENVDLSALAERRVKEDGDRLANCRASKAGADTSLMCSYWSGRLHDDSEVSSFLAGIHAAKAPGAASGPWRFEDFVRDCKNKMENEIAMIELSKSFPPFRSTDSHTFLAGPLRGCLDNGG